MNLSEVILIANKNHVFVDCGSKKKTSPISLEEFQMSKTYWKNGTIYYFNQMKPCVPPKLVMLCLRQLLHAVSDQTELYCWAKSSKKGQKRKFEHKYIWNIICYMLPLQKHVKTFYSCSNKVSFPKQSHSCLFRLRPISKIYVSPPSVQEITMRTQSSIKSN